MRQIVLDTETTGLDPAEGHRIIEIGCVELINRRLTGNNFHYYLQPDRDIDEGAIEVHGITNEFLVGKPRFPDIVSEFLGYINGAELIIHNASFDVGFLNHEMRLADEGLGLVADYCRVTDTLLMARKLHPGQKNNLDALCRRYSIDNSRRELHGALLDSEILADVYLIMTGGQAALTLDGVQSAAGPAGDRDIQRLKSDRPALKVIRASDVELQAHAERLQAVGKASGGNCVWPITGQ